MSGRSNRMPGWPIILLVVLLCTILAVPALAGQGDSSGGGKNKPLALVSSSPANGQQDVPLPVEIKCSFSKNVVYMMVRDNNKKCFSLYSADGKKIPVEVVMADDQVDFEMRRDVILKPLQGLEPGTKYLVKVAPELESKSGVNLGQEVVIEFVTAGAVKPAAPAVEKAEKDAGEAGIQTSGTKDLQQPGSETSDLESASAGETGQADLAAEAAAAESEETKGAQGENEGESSEQGVRWGIVLAVVVVLAILGYLSYRNQKRV